jgi:alkylhydroperoxidase/carboxymuconolactone decarboxylase family protein YurZ
MANPSIVKPGSHRAEASRAESECTFNDIWTREPLSPRERSLVTLGALTALGRVQQLLAYPLRPAKWPDP